MATLIVLALSNLATMLLTAWLLHRERTGQSPLPRIPAKSNGQSTPAPEPEYPRGRPIL